MTSTVRQRSEDRQPTQPRDIQRKENGRQKDTRENGRSNLMKDQKENRPPNSFSSSLREGSGHSFLNNLKSSATKGAGALSKGLFGKSGRSGSTNEKEPFVDDMHYELKVLNRPLVEQTRLTRISKKLEDSRGELSTISTTRVAMSRVCTEFQGLLRKSRDGRGDLTKVGKSVEIYDILLMVNRGRHRSLRAR